MRLGYSQSAWTYIRIVRFNVNGSQEEWRKITIVPFDNHRLAEIEIHIMISSVPKFGKKMPMIGVFIGENANMVVKMVIYIIDRNLSGVMWSDCSMLEAYNKDLGKADCTNRAIMISHGFP